MGSTTRRMRLAVAGGGTGGHVLPALAVIAELRERQLLDGLIWIGSHDGHEQQAARDADIRYVAIPTAKLRRYISLSNATDAARFPVGIIAARRALHQYAPNVVLSTGGFVSVPTVIAARGIAPVVTHEQTAIIGLANRINARFATVLAVSHQDTLAAASKVHRQVAVTGNPVRSELPHGDRQRGLEWMGFSANLPVLYVTGGARGASPINTRIAALLPQLLEFTQVLHQTGPASANADAASLTELRDALPAHVRQRYKIVEFVRGELPDVYAAADLVLGRAGAGTVAELAFVGLPAILIPLPGAGGDEQTINARVLENVGAAIVITQNEATPERLMSLFTEILGSAERRQRMSEAARTVAQPDAAARLANILIDLLES